MDLIPRNEAQTRFELIDPALETKGWIREHIKVEKSTGGITVQNGKTRRRKGRTDYLLRLIISKDTQPVAVALIEAKAAVRNIVFFKYVKSPISFHQMVGRGTRLADNKMMFTIYDYTDATRLFSNDFKSKPIPPRTGGEGGEGRDKSTIIEADGFEVEISPDGQYVVSEIDGQIKRITLADYKKGIAQKLLSNLNSFEDFRNRWIAP